MGEIMKFEGRDARLVVDKKNIQFKSKLFGRKNKGRAAIAYSQVVSVDYRPSNGLNDGYININTSSGDYKVSFFAVKNKKASSVVDFINKMKESKIEIDNENKEADIFTQIEKLGVLKEKGLITDDEFIKKKAALLNI